jgi:hypothetical protein
MVNNIPSVFGRMVLFYLCTGAEETNWAWRANMVRRAVKVVKVGAAWTGS